VRWRSGGWEFLSTFIVRIQMNLPGDLKGTVERPGEDAEPFQSGAELLELLHGWTPGPDGNGSGSTSSSAIRAT
jgi:hypothetical protein